MAMADWCHHSCLSFPRRRADAAGQGTSAPSPRVPVGSPHPGPCLSRAISLGVVAPQACEGLTPDPVYPADSSAQRSWAAADCEDRGKWGKPRAGGTVGLGILQGWQEKTAWFPPLWSHWSRFYRPQTPAHTRLKSPPQLRLGWGHGDGLTTSTGKLAAPGWGQHYSERPSPLSLPRSDRRTVEGAHQDQAHPRA